MVLKTKPGVFSSSGSIFLSLSCILVVAFQISLVKCAETCGVGVGVNKGRIDQEPFPLVVNSSSTTSAAVTLTCFVDEANTNDASYFWSVLNQRVTCDQKVTSSPSCTFRPTIIDGHTSPYKCESVTDGYTRADSFFCNISISVTCGTSTNLRMEQKPSPLVVNSANPSPQVTLTCVLLIADTNGATYHWTRNKLGLACDENNVNFATCTFRPVITNGLTPPVTCTAFHSGSISSTVVCDLVVSEESSNDNTNATITTTVGQATTSQAAGGNEGTTEARAINPTSSGNTTAQADSTGGGETTTAVGKATTVLQVTTKTPPSAMITGGAKTPPTTKMLPVPTPHQAHPSTRKTPPKTQAPTTTHGHKMNNPEASKNKGQRLRVDGYLFFGLACLYFTV